MNALRWVLIVVTVLFGAGWIALVSIGSGFRQSFGASAIGPLVTLSPLPVAVLILVSLRGGASRTLLHSTAAVVVIAIGLLLWSVGGKVDPSLVVVFLFLGLWLVYYGLSVS
jgi:hypothetical protein